MPRRTHTYTHSDRIAFHRIDLWIEKVKNTKKMRTTRLMKISFDQSALMDILIVVGGFVLIKTLSSLVCLLCDS